MSQMCCAECKKERETAERELRELNFKKVREYVQSMRSRWQKCK